MTLVHLGFRRTLPDRSHIEFEGGTYGAFCGGTACSGENDEEGGAYRKASHRQWDLGGLKASVPPLVQSHPARNRGGCRDKLHLSKEVGF